MDVRRVTINDCELYLGDVFDVLSSLPPIALCVADPPYSAGGLMRSDRTRDPLKKYASANYLHSFTGDNRDQHSFTFWASFWMRMLCAHMEDGGYFFCFIDWRQLSCIVDAIQVAGFIYRGIIPWNKTEAVRPQKGFFRNQCEYIVYGTKGAIASENILSGFFTYNAPYGAERVHPTQKPTEVLEHLLQIQQKGIVLDPFMGSGSTGIAAIRHGRKFIGIERDPEWFEVARKRGPGRIRKPGVV